MIYLIDDNQGNQQVDKFGIQYINEGLFSDFLVSIERLEKNVDLSFVKNAECILLHTTTEDIVNGNFKQGSVSNATKIIKEISDNGEKIPLVLFSEQMSEIAIMPNQNYIRAIKKSTFYSNLFDFLSLFKESKELEFKILANGKNFRSIEISSYLRILTENLEFRNANDLIKLKDINLKVFNLLIEMSSINCTFEKLIEDLEDSPVTVQKFRENLAYINQSFTNYGKNIYGWL
jgi:hypothetical protein